MDIEKEVANLNQEEKIILQREANLNAAQSVHKECNELLREAERIAYGKIDRKLIKAIENLSNVAKQVIKENI
ncbi:MAG: hypothetical protein ACYC0L_08270 [Thermoleophilia bacterium]